MAEFGSGRRIDWLAVGAIIVSAASSLLVAYVLADFVGLLN